MAAAASQPTAEAASVLTTLLKDPRVADVLRNPQTQHTVFSRADIEIAKQCLEKFREAEGDPKRACQHLPDNAIAFLTVVDRYPMALTLLMLQVYVLEKSGHFDEESLRLVANKEGALETLLEGLFDENTLQLIAEVNVKKSHIKAMARTVCRSADEKPKTSK